MEAVLSARELIAGVAGVSLSRLSDDDVDGLLPAVEELSRCLARLQHGLAGEVGARGIDLARGYKSTANYLRDTLRVTRADANRRIAAAERFSPRSTLAGEPLPPRYPQVAAALAAGEVSPDHASVITTSLEALPAAVDTDARDVGEAHLVECARQLDPHGVARRARHLESVLDPDGVLVTEADQRASREFTVSKDLHGMYRLRGLLDPEAATLLQQALDPLAKPTPPPGADRDPRTAGQRRADALTMLAQWALGPPDMPSSGGSKPHVTITVGLTDLQHRTGLADLSSGDPVSIDTAVRLLCDASVSLAVLGGHGEILRYGRATRTVPPGLRRALITRDRGCVFDGCDAHHLTRWVDGGPTDIEFTVLICRWHHTLPHHPSRATRYA